MSQPLDVINVTVDCRFTPGLVLFPFLLLAYVWPLGVAGVDGSNHQYACLDRRVARCGHVILITDIA